MYEKYSFSSGTFPFLRESLIVYSQNPFLKLLYMLDQYLDASGLGMMTSQQLHPSFNSCHAPVSGTMRCPRLCALSQPRGNCSPQLLKSLCFAAGTIRSATVCAPKRPSTDIVRPSCPVYYGCWQQHTDFDPMPLEDKHIPRRIARDVSNVKGKGSERDR